MYKTCDLSHSPHMPGIVIHSGTKSISPAGAGGKNRLTQQLLEVLAPGTKEGEIVSNAIYFPRCMKQVSN